MMFLETIRHQAFSILIEEVKGHSGEKEDRRGEVRREKKMGKERRKRN